VWWEWIAAIVSAVAAVAGSVQAWKLIVKHESEQCDARLDAYKEGLKHGEHEDH
jgi:hypothetical protein